MKTKIYLGADHAGFKLKEKIKEYLDLEEFDFEDLTRKYKEGDDYPDIAFELGEKVVNAKAAGILVCGSGAGMSIAVNKVKGIRAIEAYNELSAKLSKQDNDSNVLVLGSWLINEGKAIEIIRKWLKTEFSGLERHKKRINKISRYEKKR